jgi:hypothetical protein
MKKYGVFSFFFLFSIVLSARQQPLSAAENERYIQTSPKNAENKLLGSDAEISLITMAPGNDLPLFFGHSALRVYDPRNHRDQLFNYGIYPGSDDPFFVVHFISGKMNYMVGASAFKQTAAYDRQEENRYWYEQVLYLDQQQKETLYAFLLWNIKKENCSFPYDCVRKNCATQIRDVLYNICGNNIKYNRWQPDDEQQEMPDSTLTAPLTYRKLIDEKLTDHPASKFGIDLLLGSISDRPITNEEALFIPEYLMRICSTATIVSNGTEKPLVTDFRVAQIPSLSKNAAGILSPRKFSILLWSIFGIFAVLTIIQILSSVVNTPCHRLNHCIKLTDNVLFFSTGLVGLLIWYMTFFSSHYAVRMNLNWIWLFPLNCAAAFFPVFHKPFRFEFFFWCLVTVFAIIPAACGSRWPQVLNPDFYPVMALIVLRSGYQIFRTAAVLSSAEH